MYFVTNDTWYSFTIKSMKFKPKSFFFENTCILNVIYVMFHIVFYSLNITTENIVSSQTSINAKKHSIKTVT